MKDIIANVMKTEEENGSEQAAGVWRFRTENEIFYSVITYYESDGDLFIPVTKIFIREKPGNTEVQRKRRDAVEKSIPQFPSDLEVGEIGEAQTQTNIVSGSGDVTGTCDSDLVCECYNGYVLVGENDCTDVDECSENPDICGGDVAGFCFNNIGGFDCRCNSGFYLFNDTCTDIDECSFNTELCSDEGQECVNTYGSYSCGCATGYVEVETLVNLETIKKCVWPEWSEWTDWSNNCNVDTGEGIRQRSCSVKLPNSRCPGEASERRTCG